MDISVLERALRSALQTRTVRPELALVAENCWASTNIPGEFAAAAETLAQRSRSTGTRKGILDIKAHRWL